jgi:predicted nucleic acid-binding Zn finger protein
MKILKRGKKFKVESGTKGTFYDVSLEKKTCTCLHYQFRMAKEKGECKHITGVREWVSERVEKKGKGILDYVREHQPVDVIELMDKYGQSIVNDLIATGELIEESGKIEILS